MKAYALIGDPIDDSPSPAVHNAAFRALGMDCAYMAYRVGRDELAEGVDSLRAAGLAGFNVAAPHKTSIVAHLDSVAESCSVAGSANTVQSQGGLLRGHNTALDGFLQPLRERGVDVRGSRVLLLGAGSAARAVAAGLAGEGAGLIRVCNRTLERAKNLAAYIARLGASSDYGSLPSSAGDRFDIVVNSIPPGAGGDVHPVDVSGMAPGTVACDMVYRPVSTDFLRQAKKAGAVMVYGWEVLLAQAELAFEIWHGVEAPRDAMKRALLGGF